MRILVCSKRDFLGCYFLNRLLPRLTRHEVGVWLSEVVRPAENRVPELAELAFIERGLFVDDLFPILDQLPQALRSDAPLATFAGLRDQHAIEITTIDTLASRETRRRLTGFAPDLIVSARFSHIFDTATIEASGFGIVNLHPGALPRFAGLFAPMRSVIAGQDTLTGTLHWIDEGIDTGPILACRTRPLDRHGGLLPQIAEVYCDLLGPFEGLLAALAKGERPAGAPQDRSLREYRSLPSPAEIAQFRATGMAFWKPEELSVWIRSFRSPEPGAAETLVAARECW